MTLAGTATISSLSGCLGVVGRPKRLSYPLDRNDPRVRAALVAEKRAYEHYELEFDEHFVDVDALDLRIRVVAVGSGDPAVAIAGGIGESVKWLPLLPELSNRTLYILDRPGSGLSDGIDHRALPLERIAATTTAAVFDHFGFDATPLIGSSMGGLWTLRFALAHPERVEQIALLGTPALYPGTSAPGPQRITSVPGIGGFLFENVVQPDTPADSRNGWTVLGHPDETVTRLPDEYAEVTYRMDNLPYYTLSWVSVVQSALNLWGAVPKAALTPDDLRRIRSPVSLIWGSDDPFGSPETGRAGAEYFPDATFHDAGVGHLPWLDEPAACGELIRGFLGEKA